MNFEDILLEPEQEQLLIRVVEGSRNTSHEKRQKFLVVQSDQGDLLLHSGIINHNIYHGDVEELGRQNLLAVSSTSQGNLQFDVTPFGFRYYEHLKKKSGELIQQVEFSIIRYIHSSDFDHKYPEAYSRLSQAEKLLWQSDSPEQYTTIGHLCREAIQKFVSHIVTHHKLECIDTNEEHTVARLRVVFEKLGFSKTRAEVFEALIKYFGTVSDLIQRQEHGSKKERELLIWEDARCVVFQTFVIMYEIDRNLN